MDKTPTCESKATRQAKFWPLQRRRELQKLRTMLYEVSSINNGGAIIERLQRCRKVSTKLIETNYDGKHVSFIQFLENESFGE